MVRLLASRGAEVDYKNEVSVVIEVCESVPLVAMLLLVHVHFLIAQTGETALMFAASHGKYDVVVELITLEADVDI